MKIVGHERLEPTQAGAVAGLAARMTERDGASALSDDALAHLDDPERRHFVAYDVASALIGYAQRAGDTAELVGDTAAVEQLFDQVECDQQKLTVWSHGQRSPIAGIALERGYRRARVLWQLRKDLSAAASPDVSPPGVTIRQYRGADDDGILRVNAEAFADHPEQGGWTAEDLRARMATDWFEPAGLLVAIADGEPAGFHWTKVHSDGGGEVYVIAAAPSWQGRGLGRALLNAGLNSLQARGVDAVRLYVDESNAHAMRMYRNDGFTPFDCDVQLTRELSQEYS